MNDQELFEMAAKAAGWVKYDQFKKIFRHVLPMGFLGEEWNPLDDDGDALRLAATLNLSIITAWGFDGNPSGSVGAMLGSHDDLRITSTAHDGDKFAAWRRAIVRAAYEIGKSMP